MGTVAEQRHLIIIAKFNNLINSKNRLTSLKLRIRGEDNPVSHDEEVGNMTLSDFLLKFGEVIDKVDEELSREIAEIQEMLF